MALVYVTDDEPNICKLVAFGLKDEGFETATFTDGNSLLEAIQKRKPDAIILDWMMPPPDGLTICRSLRSEEDTKYIPILLLTARGAEVDKVLGLELGADDYIVKPFETVELLARIEVVLRRKHKSNNTIHYGDITMNIDEHTVKKGDDYVSLTPKEFDILAFFLQNQDIALTRERLLATVWGYEFMGETRTVDIHVQQIRKKMGLHNKLVTIPKLGYRLERNN